MNFNYQKLCKSLLDGVQSRAKEVIERRFGLKGHQPETLEGIGEDFKITRERVRQIQERAIRQIKENKQDQLSGVFANFSQAIVKKGGVIREDEILKEWADKDSQNQVLFLLNLSDEFKFSSANKDFYAFWYNNENAVKDAKKTVDNFIKFLKTKGTPVALKEFEYAFSPETLKNYIGLSTQVLCNAEGLYGLAIWPEVNPRNIRDKAYLALKKMGKPLHFGEIYDIITNQISNSKNILLQSVHNELIRNQEFVLIGRGIYALKEWGYAPGWVKDILAESLKLEKKGLSKDELIEKVLAQRKVKKSTILLNLSDKNYFLRDNDGKYILKA